MNLNMDKLEYLLANKSYESLSADERNWVDQQYSASEYSAMRIALLNSQRIFKNQETKPSPAIKTRLRQNFQQHNKPERPAPFLSYRIPAWQAVAAIALLLFFLPQMRSSIESDPEKIFIYQTDTVFKEIPAGLLINPLIDTMTSIPKVRKILSRTNRSPIKASTVVFSRDSALSAGLSKEFVREFESDYDTASVDNIISRYLKDSVKNYRVSIDSGFQDMGRIY